MDEQTLCFLEISTLAAQYRTGTLSPVDATETILNRIHRLDGSLNAFITVLSDSALAQAHRAEEELARGEDKGPLHGVPVSLKDIYDTAGIRTTAGSRILKDHVPGQTATSALRLMAAGSVLCGKCNLLEFAHGVVHPDYGQCNNPWDTSRTSGGSSSGSAASMAAGMGWGSLGTDTGGSIRIPAAYCGVVGLKPTYGRVSRHGVFPLSWSLDHAGPITRTVEDMAIVLQAIAGYDPLDPSSSRDPVPDYRAALSEDVRGLKVGVLEQHMGNYLHAGVEEVIREAIADLGQAGMRIRPIEIPSLAEADPAMLLAILPEGTVVHEEWLRSRPEDYAEGTRSQLELGALLPAVDYVRVQQFRGQLLTEFLQAFEQVDVIVSPSAPYEAPAEDPEVAGVQGYEEARCTCPYNLTGLPAVSVPCGFGPAGLPLGLQIAGPPMAEGRILRVAHIYERRAGWVRKHPPVG